jgi:hypothetical protein
MSLPDSLDGFTPEFLTSALSSNYPGVEVTGVTVEEVILGTSSNFRLGLTYNAAGLAAGLPVRVIVKGSYVEHGFDMGGMYLSEMRFYRDARTLVDMNMPTCLYAGRDPESGRSILILEDLSLRGARFFNAFKTQSYEQSSRRLEAMADFHAQTWNSPELDSGGKLDWVPVRYAGREGALHSAQVSMNAHYLSEDVWPTVMENPRATATPSVLRDIDWMRGALEKMSAAHLESDTCMIHGDSHLGNLYEDADGTPGFLDPAAARAPWSMEVAYHLVGALEVPDRRRWEKPLLATYLARLTARGIDAPSFDEAWDSYVRDICHGLFIWIVNESEWQLEAINTANSARFGVAAIDCGTYEMLR